MNQASSPDPAAEEHRAAEALLRLMVAFARSGSRDIGVTASLTLVTLDFCGPLRITELATMEGVSQPSMSGVVSSLERAGLVERQPDPRDRRVVLVALTDGGKALLQQRRESGVQMLCGLLDALSQRDRRAFLSTIPLLERLSAEAARQQLGIP